MDRIFWVTCPQCQYRFSVDYSLRHDPEVRLECPSSRTLFGVDDAASILE
ncbi:hypothetical protein [Nocardioides hungaricus]